MSRLSRGRRVARALAPTAVAVMLLGFGVWIGQWLGTRDLARSFEVHGWNETLGGIVDAAASSGAGGPGARGYARSDYAKAYLDPARAEREMDDYSFAVPMVPSPFVGSAPAPGRHANARISRQQLRHEGELAIPKPADRVRVFVTGGSTAYGAGAPSQRETIPGYLQSLVDARLSGRGGRRFEIVNAAAPAWASTQERIWIEHHLSELEPDVVVSLSGINDVHWGAIGHEVLWFRPYADAHYFDVLNLVRQRIGVQPFVDVAAPAAERVAPQRVSRNLTKNAALAAGALALEGADYVFALQPMIAVTRKPLTEREQLPKAISLLGPDIHGYFRECFDAIREALTDDAPPGVHFVDLTGVFDAAGADEEIFLDSYHFGDRGNERLAEALYRSLEARLAGESD